jgi:DNA (cytosine-5)-methyltransferase 1
MTRLLTQGSHFDGISAFPLAASKYGIKTVWATEIEKFPIEVSKHHFPSVKHYGDITKVSGYDLTPVDIVTFGSPCQDLSVAGKRQGLCGKRSGLFAEAVRTIREMRDATGGKYPRYAIWENVPGAFSSNGGQDFNAVLEEITESKIPMPKSGKWANAGMVRGNGRSVAWRVLDAQHWGVPQRRRRIFLIADFAGQRAPEILFERESVCRDIAQGGKTRGEVAANAGDGAKNTGKCLTPWDSQGNRIVSSNGVSLALRGNGSGGYPNVYLLARHIAFNGRQDPVSGPIAGSLDCCHPQAQCVAFGPGGQHDIAYAVRAQPSKADKPSSTTYICEAYPVPANNLLAKGNLSFRGDQDNLVTAVDCRNLCENEELSGTLQCKQTGGYSLNYQNPVRIGYAVRRLTPTECERLMGFPDGWTDGGSDTARYKALGNSIAVPCLEWIYGQLIQPISQ